MTRRDRYIRDHFHLVSTCLRSVARLLVLRVYFIHFRIRVPIARTRVKYRLPSYIALSVCAGFGEVVGEVRRAAADDARQSNAEVRVSAVRRRTLPARRPPQRRAGGAVPLPAYRRPLPARRHLSIGRRRFALKDDAACRQLAASYRIVGSWGACARL